MKNLLLLLVFAISSFVHSQDEDMLFIQGKIGNSEGVTYSELWVYDDNNEWVQLGSQWLDEGNYALQFVLGYTFIVKFRDDNSERVIYIKATHPDFLEIGVMMDKTNNLMVGFIEGDYRIFQAPPLNNK